jgi:adenine/guanine/hypoxanthine permease
MLAGLTTFTTMAYVVVVNPRILSEAGMPVEGVLFATCISAALATLVMGLWANYPIALAPGMSLNAYFTYSIVIGRGVPWQTALGVVFISGTLFLILTLTNVREMIVRPRALAFSSRSSVSATPRLSSPIPPPTWPWAEFPIRKSSWRRWACW